MIIGRVQGQPGTGAAWPQQYHRVPRVGEYIGQAPMSGSKVAKVRAIVHNADGTISIYVDSPVDADTL